MVIPHGETVRHSFKESVLVDLDWLKNIQERSAEEGSMSEKQAGVVSSYAYKIPTVFSSP